MQGDRKTRKRPHVPEAGAYLLAAKRRRLVGSMFLLCCPMALQAAEWSFDPSATVAVGYETNAALTVDPHDAVSEVILVPGLVVRRVTETSAVDFGVLAAATYYSGNEFEDMVDGRVVLCRSFSQPSAQSWVSMPARAGTTCSEQR